MKKSLREELERIHTITYGKQVVTEENIIDKIWSLWNARVEKAHGRRPYF